MFQRLTGRDSEPIEGAPEWATDLHEQLGDMSEFKKARNMLSRTRNWHGAGRATAKLSEALRGIDVAEDEDEKDAAAGNARAALEQALDEALDMEEMMAGLGFDDSDGMPSQVDAEERYNLANEIMCSRELKQLLKLAGRFRRIAKAKVKGRPRHGAGTLTGIEMGDSISRLLPSELVALKHPKLKTLLKRKLTEKAALQYRLQSVEPEGKGPIVVCLDTSGSMQGARDLYAKAIFAGILQTAKMDDRDVHLVFFDTRVQREFSFSGKLDKAHFMEALRFFSGGGTNFLPPMQRARDIIEAEPEMRDADIVFITDGSALTPDLRLPEHVQVFGIGIGREASVEKLKTFCDDAIGVMDIVREADTVADAIYSNIG